MQWKGTGRKHRPIKVLLTLLLILWLLSQGLDQQLYAGIPGGFFSLMLASFVIIHFRIRPSWVDAVLIGLITAFLAIVDFHTFHSPASVMAYFSFLGLSSFVIVAGRIIWNQEPRILLYGWVPPAIYVLIGPVIDTLHKWTVKAHPQTLDLYLLSYEGSLRVQVAFVIGQYYARVPWLHNSALLAYVGVSIPMVLVYAGLLRRFREAAFPSALAFLIAGPIGFLFYNLFPACGPAYVFGKDFPFHPVSLGVLFHLTLQPIAISGRRNAMPSLHIAWTLLAWWYSKGLSWIERGIAFVFLALNEVATLGTGEHWFADLIVAFPFALMTEAICAYHLRWKDPERRAALFLGLGGTLGWIVALRYGLAFFWSSPIVPWAFSAATIALVSLRQAKFDAVANLAKHATTLRTP